MSGGLLEEFKLRGQAEGLAVARRQARWDDCDRCHLPLLFQLLIEEGKNYGVLR
jgi:hypothetical protein